MSAANRDALPGSFLLRQLRVGQGGNRRPHVLERAGPEAAVNLVELVRGTARTVRPRQCGFR